MVETAIVNCRVPRRFVKGARCVRVMACTYPEKKICEAVIAEITYLREERDKREAAYQSSIQKLIKERDD